MRRNCWRLRHAGARRCTGPVATPRACHRHVCSALLMTHRMDPEVACYCLRQPARVGVAPGPNPCAAFAHPVYCLTSLPLHPSLLYRLQRGLPLGQGPAAGDRHHTGQRVPMHGALPAPKVEIPCKVPKSGFLNSAAAALSWGTQSATTARRSAVPQTRRPILQWTELCCSGVRACQACPAVGPAPVCAGRCAAAAGSRGAAHGTQRLGLPGARGAAAGFRRSRRPSRCRALWLGCSRGRLGGRRGARCTAGCGAAAGACTHLCRADVQQRVCVWRWSGAAGAAGAAGGDDRLILE